ncbi:hypothetical protein THAOC_00986, partial [Thalassiosira oceanica]
MNDQDNLDLDDIAETIEEISKSLANQRADENAMDRSINIASSRASATVKRCISRDSSQINDLIGRLEKKPGTDQAIKELREQLTRRKKQWEEALGGFIGNFVMTAKLRFTPGLANILVRERSTLQDDLMNARSDLVRGQREASQKEAQLRERVARLEEELSTLQTTLAEELSTLRTNMAANVTEKQLLADTLAQNQRTISDLSETIEDFSKDQELWEQPGTATSVLHFTVVKKKADWNGSAVTVTKNISGKWLDVTREGKEGVGRIKIEGNQRSYILADFMGNQGSYCFGVVHESMAGKSSGNLTV